MMGVPCVYDIASSTELFTVYLANGRIFTANILHLATFFFTISGHNWRFTSDKFVLLHPLFQSLVSTTLVPM